MRILALSLPLLACAGLLVGGGCGDETSVFVTPGDKSAQLSGLKVSGGSMLPGFQRDGEEYYVTVPPWNATISVTPTALDPTASITVNGVAVASGAVSQAVPVPGPEQVVTVQVVSADRKTTKTYFLLVNWTVHTNHYLKASNPDVGDVFTRDIAISGDLIVVGADGEESAATSINGDQSDNSSPGTGAAYVFRFDGVVWKQEAYLKPSNGEAGDSFGWSVAVDGDYIVVGAPWEASAATGVNGNEVDNSAAGSGAVYVFHRVRSTWIQEAYLKASNTGSSDLFKNQAGL